MIDVIRGKPDWAVLTSSLLLLLLSTVFLLLVIRAWRFSPKTPEVSRKSRTYRVHGVPVNVSVDELCAQFGIRTPQAASYLTLQFHVKSLNALSENRENHRIEFRIASIQHAIEPCPVDR